MTDTDTIIVRYAEIGLKGKNRIDFENRLVDNIRENFKQNNIPFSKIRRLYGRIIVMTEDSSDSIRKVFGISSFSHATETTQDPKTIMEKALGHAKERNITTETTFKVDVQRIDKAFPIKSNDFAAQVGEFIINGTEAPVRMKNPDITISIELIQGKAYIFSDKRQAYGGLPIGSDSKVITLLSSGIDSPVAAFMMMKRGCSNIFVFNDNTPFAPPEERENAIKQFNNMKKYDPKAELYIVPFGKVQEAIAPIIRERFRCIFCKQLMYLVAEEIAAREHIKAIITGESIGQVASQTLDNLAILDSIAAIPILRPLIGMNKQEIIDIARDIGTYGTSSLTKGGCGFLPANPATRAKPEIIEREHGHLNDKLGDIRTIISEAVDRAEIIK